MQINKSINIDPNKVMPQYTNDSIHLYFCQDTDTQFDDCGLLVIN